MFLCRCLNVKILLSDTLPLSKTQNGLKIKVIPAPSDIACFEAIEFLKSVSLVAISSSFRERRGKKVVYLFVQNNKPRLESHFTTTKKNVAFHAKKAANSQN